MKEISGPMKGSQRKLLTVPVAAFMFTVRKNFLTTPSRQARAGFHHGRLDAHVRNAALSKGALHTFGACASGARLCTRAWRMHANAFPHGRVAIIFSLAWMWKIAIHNQRKVWGEMTAMLKAQRQMSALWVRGNQAKRHRESSVSAESWGQGGRGQLGRRVPHPTGEDRCARGRMSRWGLFGDCG